LLPLLVAEEPVEALGLEGQEVGDFEGLADLREGQTATGGLCGGHRGSGARGSQGWILPRAERVGRRCTHQPGPLRTAPHTSALRGFERSDRAATGERQRKATV